MTHRIALATCERLPELDDDGPALLTALAAEGLDVEVHPWDAPIDWSSFDLVVIRNTWDYGDRHDAYLAWTRSVARLANSAETIAWNTDKTYLMKLAEAGIPVVPTTWLRPGDTFEVPAFPFVVKPAVSSGARNTAAYEAGDEAARDHVSALLGADRTVLIQPHLAEVDTAGETAVLVFDGQVSHGARKSAVLTLGAGEPVLGGWQIEPREPSQAEVALALRVVEVAQSWGADLLYARVDLLPGPVLIELEVTEPSLFLSAAPGSAARYAQAVRRWVERS